MKTNLKYAAALGTSLLFALSPIPASGDKSGAAYDLHVTLEINVYAWLPQILECATADGPPYYTPKTLFYHASIVSEDDGVIEGKVGTVRADVNILCGATYDSMLVSGYSGNVRVFLDANSCTATASDQTATLTIRAKGRGCP